MPRPAGADLRFCDGAEVGGAAVIGQLGSRLVSRSHPSGSTCLAEMFAELARSGGVTDHRRYIFQLFSNRTLRHLNIKRILQVQP